MNQTVAGTLPTRRWGRLIPVAFITYSLAYLDRANYGFGAAAGLAEDLNITPAISSLLGALFFLGYSRDDPTQCGGRSNVICRLFRRARLIRGSLGCGLPERRDGQPCGILCLYGWFVSRRRVVNRADHLQRSVSSINAHLKCILKQAHP